MKRCAGACVGAEDAALHDQRLAAALAPLAIPAWPVAGVALVREPAAAGERTDVHVLRDWCWLGTARDDGELGRLLEAPPPSRFDIDVARMLLKRWSKRALPLVPAPDPMSVDAGP